MKISSKVAISVLLTTLAAGCSDSRNGVVAVEPAPLTAGQREQVIAFSQSVATTEDALATFEGSEAKALDPASPAAKIKLLMGAAIQAGYCLIQGDPNTSPINLSDGKTHSMEMSVKVIGGPCPIAVDFQAKGTINTSDFNYSGGMSYQVLSEELRKLSDVDSFNEQFTMHTHYTSDASNMTTGTNGTTEVTFSIHSQLYGPVTVSAVRTLSSGVSQTTVDENKFRMEFAGFTVKARETTTTAQDGTKKLEVYLNNVKLTDDEMKRYRSFLTM